MRNTWNSKLMQEQINDDTHLVIAIMFYISAVLMFLNDLLLIGPSLVYNFC